MADLQRISTNDHSSTSHIGEVLLSRLNAAIASANFGEIAMVLSQDRSRFTSHELQKLEESRTVFVDMVWHFVTDTLPKVSDWCERKTVSIDDAVRAIRSIADVRHELVALAKHQIIPTSKRIALTTLVQQSEMAVYKTIVEHGDGIRDQFASRIRDIVVKTNTILDSGSERAVVHEKLCELSRQAIEVFDQSCLLEDNAKGWYLQKAVRQPLRVISKRLTGEAGIPTHLKIRAVTNPGPESWHKRR